MSQVDTAPGERGTSRVDAPPRENGEPKPSRRLGVYLRRLREGYGYTLRKVEEKAFALGEAIDNSQLSRFEKGKALPSFDKLRALARIFNVSVQNFSDVLDLEEFEAFRPETNDRRQLLEQGEAWFARGEAGRAFVAFEKALEMAEDEGDAQGADAYERIVDARWRMAAALKALGKLQMAEHELREILRLRRKISRRVQLRTLRNLCYVYREMSDLYLAQILARESLDLAIEEEDVPAQAAILNTLGNVNESDSPDLALPYYQRSQDLLRDVGGHDELLITVLVNLGGCMVRLHRFEEGLTRLTEARTKATSKGFRRIAALASTRLGEAYLQRGDDVRAMMHLDESDATAASTQSPHVDILFLNAFHRWEVARRDGNPTREKVAFGRLRHLRSQLERRFPEVDTFDRYVERNRRRHHENAL